MNSQQTCTNLRDFYLVKKGPKHSDMGKSPPPNSGNSVLFFPDVKTTFYAYDKKKVPMIIMIIAMTIMIVMVVILMIMMKKLPKNIQILLFFSNNVPILGTFTW